MITFGYGFRHLLLSGSLAVMALAGTSAMARPLGDVTIAVHYNVDTLDGSQSVTTPHRSLFQNIYDPLLTYDADGAFVPNLAESWERIGEDVVRFHLRQGVEFTNGEPFDAHAVKFTFDLTQEPNSQSRNNFSIFTEVTVVDDFTIDFKTNGPDSEAISRVADYLYPVPPKYYQEVGPEAFSAQPIGTGPYKVKEWRRGDRVVLEANEGWWKGDPKADNVVFWTVPEASTRVAAVLSGEADIASQIPPIQVSQVENSSTARIEASTAGVQPVWAGMIVDREPFDDLRVRQAINYAIDKQALVDRLLRGYGRVMGQPCPANMSCYDPSVEPYPYDPEKAKALLEEAGVENLSITLDAPAKIVPQAAEVSQFIAASLERIGIKVTIRLDEWSVYTSRLYDNNSRQSELGDVFLLYYRAGITSPTTLKSYLNSKSSWNWTHLENPRVDELWELASVEFDTEKQTELLQEFSRIIHDEAPWLFLYEPLSLWAVSNEYDWTATNDDFMVIERMNPAG